MSDGGIMAGFQCNVCGGSHGSFLREKEELEECYKHFRSKHVSDCRALRETIRGLKIKLEGFKIMLSRHGGHTDDCTYHTMRFAAFKDKPLCNCGWAEIEKVLDVKES